VKPIQHEPGWHGAFTRNEALGAWRNGTPVVKQNSEPYDSTPDGTPGVVLGSIPDYREGGQMFYFVEWADKPKVAVGCDGRKLRAVS
jgi:hypothetical protein